ncbi:TSUP family transporter [Halomonas piscis]|uniref:Probable membrane transporter protein n=1 Tax=Halomonas piscis TaxID=3031727 RepID=A0ABY9Z105_9GAMM|nr:TSUP family transporter [Halomonas piscis]WNK19903.1 TSUP family transporter [Halomonas piscis]
MDIVAEVPWLFLLIAGLGGYLQTVTGFGLGMVVMGLAGGLEVASVATVAAVISLMLLINCVVALPGRLQHIEWPSAGAVMVGVVPSILAGVAMLHYLSDEASSVLRVVLGGVILYGAAGLLLKPTHQAHVASPASFTLFGGFSGFLGGLLGIAGPPLIYHYYRQPLPPARIRNTLILLFAVTAGMRTLFIAVQGQLSLDILALVGWSLPAVVAATWVGRRWPPPLSALAMRRLVFAMLMIIGASLIAAGLTF